jgi:class 3 adenylate cyclase
MMADIRGFTSISSQRAPEEVVTMVNNFLSVMTDIIIDYGGTIDEFIGDAILALFGAPNAMDDHAEKAVACALEMQIAMDKVNELNRQAGLPEIATGIGINTGEVIVGNIGSEKRAKYGVVGHHVNFTSRIESYTAGGQILIPERTFEACEGMVQIRGEMSVRPKGFDEDVRLFDVLSMGEPYNTSLLK